MYLRSFDLTLFPYERLGDLVVVLDERLDGSDQFSGTVKAGSSKHFAPQDVEPDFNWVQPAR
jgi:hypothetical protein